MPFAAQIENVRAAISNVAGSGAAEDFRTLAEGLVQWTAAHNPNPPATVNPAIVTSTQAAPTGVSASVTGGNGVYTIAIDNGQQNGRTVWTEVSYSTVQSFTIALTTMPPTAATSVTINKPGQTFFFRIRSSFDQKSWSTYRFIGDSPVAAVSSGLLTSAASGEGVTFNQTNYAVVSSATSGGAALVTIAGASGATTALVRQKGPVQQTLPGAVVDNVPFGVNLFVGYNMDPGYRLLPTLADVLQDDLVPIGKVSVVDSGTPSLPTITPIIVNGYIVGATWTGDNGLSAPPALTVTDPGSLPPASGAVLAVTGVSGGHIEGIQVLNSGNGHYDSNTVVTPSGGIGAGTPGGGLAAGGNGGRMTAV